MLSSLSDSRAHPRWITKRSRRSLSSSFVATALSLMISSAQSTCAQGLGQWSGPYPWPYVIAPPTGQTTDKEISHAALIPVGVHAGKVLLFSWQGQGYPDTDTFWFFNPDAPTDLVRLSQNINANIFCSGMSFDAQGHLLAAGGVSQSHGFPDRTVKLDPFKLGPIAYPTGGGVGVMGYDPNAPPWRMLGNMALKRFYPTVLPLSRRYLYFTNSSIPTVPIGGANLVLGGPLFVGCNTADGNEVMEVLPFRATNWRAPLLPPQSSVVHTTELPTSLTRETYSLQGTPSPSVLLDSYPRAAQLSNGDIHVAGDIDTLRQGVAAPDHAWVFKSYQPGSTPDWQLHRAQPDVERYYGTAWLMHFRGINGLDRWFHAGGSRDQTVPSYPGGSCTQSSGEQLTNGLALASVSELPNLSTVQPQQRIWTARATLNQPRVFANAVVLPTGQVIFTGGARKDYHRPYMNDTAKCPDPVTSPSSTTSEHPTAILISRPPCCLRRATSSPRTRCGPRASTTTSRCCSRTFASSSRAVRSRTTRAARAPRRPTSPRPSTPVSSSRRPACSSGIARRGSPRRRT